MKTLKIKISLEKTKIYREVIVYKEITYHDLHMVIQKVFGWEDYHLYEFIVDGNKIGNLENDDFGHLTSEAKDTLIFTNKKKFQYEYDFGDAWEHTIEIIEELDADPKTDYPVCVGGKGACPPEDCGGVDGYRELVKAMKRGSDAKKKEFKEWLGYDYDPDAFTVEWANERLNDPDCCRKGYSIEDLAQMTGKSTSTIRRWFKKLEDNELKDYLWKYEGKTLVLDPEGVPVLMQHLR